jgi:HlyD family secretion protein
MSTPIASSWKKRWRVARPRTAVLVAAGAALVLAVASASYIGSRGGLAYVPTAKVKRGDVRITIVETGELRAEHQVTVSAPTDKQIVWLVPEGTRVAEGDLLLRFETQKYEIGKSAAESALAVARADLKRALGDLENQQASEERARLEYAALPDLADKGFVNRGEVDSARLGYQGVRATTRSYEAAVEAARANVERAEREVEQQERKLREGTVHASRGGVVVYATTGDSASPRKITEGLTPFEGQELIYLPDPSSMRVDTEISEFDLAKVQLGSPVALRLDAYSDVVFRGEVASIASLARRKISRVTGRPIGVKVFDVTISVLDDDERLKPGLSSTVEILVSDEADVTYVPIAGVFLDELDRTVVYVWEDGEVRQQAVEVSGSTDRVAIIASGVEDGQEILLDRPQQL